MSVPGGLPIATEEEAGTQDEDDLFGSGDEQDGDFGAAGLAGTDQPAAAVTTEVESDELGERELFGETGGDDDDDDIDERDLFGSGDEGPEIDEKELFGSDDEAAQQPRPDTVDASAAPGEEPPPETEPSEMDEREIFGDLSDDEPERIEDVILRRRPAPSDDRSFISLRLPNVLSVEKTPFHRDRIPQSMLEGYKEFKNTRDMQVIKLLNPENCLRWRFKKGPTGQNLTDEDGRPQYESNSRIVEWEDGSRTLLVGKEVFNCSEITDKVILFEENSQDIHVCHGISKSRLIATPRSLQSATHEALKRSQFRKYEPLRRSLLLSPEDQVETKQLQELEQEQKRRQELKQRRTADVGRAEITAAFLEEDAGPSVLDVKKQYKSTQDVAKRQKR